MGNGFIHTLGTGKTYTWGISFIHTLGTGKTPECMIKLACCFDDNEIKMAREWFYAYVGDWEKLCMRNTFILTLETGKLMTA